MRVDAKKLKGKLSLNDYEKIINALGIRWFSKSNTQWVLYNKDKHKEEALQKPKLYFYLSTCNFVSFTKGCNYDIYGLVQAVKTTGGEKYSFVDSLNFVLSVTGIDGDACQRLTPKTTYNWEDDLSKYLRFKSNGSILKTYDDRIVDELPCRFPLEWIDEGISPVTLEKYRIGYYERLQQTTIPCLGRNGELYGIRCRNWNPERINQAKYIPLTLLDGTTYSFPTNKLFYGINYNWSAIEDSKQVILVEGEKSVLKADTFLGEKSNVLALYGSNLGIDRRNEIIKMGVEEVVVALDSDYHVIGDDEYLIFEDKVKKFAKAFQGYCKVTVCYNNIGLDGYKCSPFDFDKNTFYKLFENREAIY